MVREREKGRDPACTKSAVSQGCFGSCGRMTKHTDIVYYMERVYLVYTEVVSKLWVYVSAAESASLYLFQHQADRNGIL